MDFRRLATFRAVAALMSFNKAARSLHCTQSTVSAQIRTLEQELDAELFQRLGTRIALTPAGETFLVYADKLLNLRDEARARTRGRADQGCTVSARMPQSVAERFLPEVLRLYEKRHPLVGFDVSQCAFSALEQELRTGVTDVAFLLADKVPGAHFAVRRLDVKKLVFVGDRAMAGSRRAFGWGDLAEARLLVPKHDCSYKMLLDRELRERGVRPRSLMECNSMGMLRRCVAGGLGVALAPEFSVREELERGDLAVLPWRGRPLEMGLLMIVHKNMWRSPEVRHFMDLCARVMGPEGGGRADARG